MYCEPDSELDSSQSEPLEVVITLYTFNSNNPEELSFTRDERCVRFLQTTKLCLFDPRLLHSWQLKTYWSYVKLWLKMNLCFWKPVAPDNTELQTIDQFGLNAKMDCVALLPPCVCSVYYGARITSTLELLGDADIKMTDISTFPFSYLWCLIRFAKTWFSQKIKTQIWFI